MRVDYITNSIFNSRTYILSGEGSDGVWLVDCGDVEPMLANVAGRKIVGVLLTHAHFDHIYGLPELLKHFPEVPIYTNEWGKQALANDRWNMSRYHEQSVVVDNADIRILKEGDIIELGEENLEVIETPGHNPSCLCYISKDCIFTVDAHIPGTPVVTNLPKCDKALALASEQRIIQLAQGKKIYPGHSV